MRCCCWLSSSVKFLLIRREACAKELTKSPRAITPAQLDFKRFQQLATQKWKIYKNLMSICQETVCAVPCLRAIWPSSLRRDRNLNLERNQCSLRTSVDGCTQERIHTPYPRDLTTNAPLARHTVSSPILLIRKFHAKSNADAHSNTKFDGISYLICIMWFNPFFLLRTPPKISNYRKQFVLGNFRLVNLIFRWSRLENNVKNQVPIWRFYPVHNTNEWAPGCFLKLW